MLNIQPRLPTIPDLFPIAADERVTIVGSSGSGKSYGAASLLRYQKRVLIFDTKGSKSLERDGYHIIENEDDLQYMGWKMYKDDTFIFRPNPFLSREEIHDLADRVCRFVYTNGNMILYVDEGMHVTTPTRAPDMLHALATRGRERGAGLWLASQRPKQIPMILLSEANHFFVFSLRLEADRKRIDEVSEFPITREVANLKKREFMYINPDRDRLTGPHHFQTV